MSLIWVIDDIADTRKEICAALRKRLGNVNVDIEEFDAADRLLRELQKRLKETATKGKKELLPDVLISDLFLERSYEDGTDLLRKISKTIASISTVKKLEEGWPKRLVIIIFSYYAKHLNRRQIKKVERDLDAIGVTTPDRIDKEGHNSTFEQQLVKLANRVATAIQEAR